MYVESHATSFWTCSCQCLMTVWKWICVQFILKVYRTKVHLFVTGIVMLERFAWGMALVCVLCTCLCFCLQQWCMTKWYWMHFYTFSNFFFLKDLNSASHFLFLWQEVVEHAEVRTKASACISEPKSDSTHRGDRHHKGTLIRNTPSKKIAICHVGCKTFIRDFYFVLFWYLIFKKRMLRLFIT